MACPGLLQPLSIPEYSWGHVTMEFVESFPTFEKKNVIVVVVDILPSHFIGLGHPFTALIVN